MRNSRLEFVWLCSPAATALKHPSGRSLLFMKPRFHSGHMFWPGHSYSLAHALIFMSLCSHCAHMLCLVLRCCFAAHKLAHSLQPQRDRNSHPDPPYLTELPPKSITHTPHTDKHNSPFSQKATAAGVLLRPLCDFRASQFNKVL